MRFPLEFACSARDNFKEFWGTIPRRTLLLRQTIPGNSPDPEKAVPAPPHPWELFSRQTIRSFHINKINNNVNININIINNININNNINNNN